jgi:hypothetical protein
MSTSTWRVLGVMAALGAVTLACSDDETTPDAAAPADAAVSDATAGDAVAVDTAAPDAGAGDAAADASTADASTADASTADASTEIPAAGDYRMVGWKCDATEVFGLVTGAGVTSIEMKLMATTATLNINWSGGCQQSRAHVISFPGPGMVNIKEDGITCTGTCMGFQCTASPASPTATANPYTYTTGATFGLSRRLTTAIIAANQILTLAGCMDGQTETQTYARVAGDGGI